MNGNKRIFKAVLWGLRLVLSTGRAEPEPRSEATLCVEEAQMPASICHKKRAVANRKKAQSEYQFELVSRPNLQQSLVGCDVQCVTI